MSPAAAATAAVSLADALIIGAGPAGLSAALTMARALHTAVVFDSGVFRNQGASHMHTLPTWDHQRPVDFRAASRAELAARYDTITFHTANVTAVSRSADADGRAAFDATTSDGRRWRGRILILASGVRDVLPDIDGYDRCWISSIFHCLFCHGYEERGARSAGVLAIGDVAAVPPALHLARAAARLAATVTLYTDGDDTLAAALEAALRADEKEKGTLRVDTRSLTRLVKESEGTDVSLHFADGSTAREGFLVHRPKTQLNGPFAQQLGLELSPQGDVQTAAPFGETSVKGVFAAGDCASQGKIVANAIATGAFAGAGASAQLQASVL